MSDHNQPYYHNQENMENNAPRQILYISWQRLSVQLTMWQIIMVLDTDRTKKSIKKNCVPRFGITLKRSLNPIFKELKTLQKHFIKN